MMEMNVGKPDENFNRQKRLNSSADVVIAGSPSDCLLGGYRRICLQFLPASKRFQGKNQQPLSLLNCVHIFRMKI